MPFEFESDSVTRTLHLRGHGTGSFEDAMATVDELEVVLCAHPADRLLIDNVDYKYDARTQELERMARRLAALRSVLPPQIALVVRPGLQYGLARMFATLAGLSGLEIGVFTSLGAAEESLHSPGA